MTCDDPSGRLWSHRQPAGTCFFTIEAMGTIPSEYQFTAVGFICPLKEAETVQIHTSLFSSTEICPPAWKYSLLEFF